MPYILWIPTLLFRKGSRGQSETLEKLLRCQFGMTGMSVMNESLDNNRLLYHQINQILGHFKMMYIERDFYQPPGIDTKMGDYVLGSICLFICNLMAKPFDL